MDVAKTFALLRSTSGSVQDKANAISESLRGMPPADQSEQVKALLSRGSLTAEVGGLVARSLKLDGDTLAAEVLATLAKQLPSGVVPSYASKLDGPRADTAAPFSATSPMGTLIANKAIAAPLSGREIDDAKRLQDFILRNMKNAV